MKEELCAMYNPAAFQRITGIQRELVESTEKGSESPFFLLREEKPFQIYLSVLPVNDFLGNGCRRSPCGDDCHLWSALKWVDGWLVCLFACFQKSNIGSDKSLEF